MLKKYPKGSFKSSALKGVKVILYAELAFFGGAYYVWHRMNTSQDFRHTMHEKYPSILSVFYMVGEKLGKDYQIRKLDYEVWGIDTTPR